MKIALEILKINNQSKIPLDIYLTRYSDTLISLEDRTKLAKFLNAGLFISLHCNHSYNKTAAGVEVYASKKQAKYSNESVYMGFLLEKSLTYQIGYKSRGVKFANFQVLRETIGYCSSILLELGFLSNWDEEKFYSSALNIKAVALTLLKSLIKSRIL